MDTSFINKVKLTILEHIEDEKFGVADLASEVGFSKSQIGRKIRASTGKSANQFIRETRLQEAAKLIRKNEFTASEIAYRVGFSSPSYFNKCFHDHFGITPGDFGEESEEEIKDIQDKTNTTDNNSFKKPKIFFSVILFLIALLLTSYFINKTFMPKNKLQNSIAVLYFDDMSSSGDTQWFCDGITDEIYTNLSKFKNLKVISRTSTKSYMNSDKAIPEIARELNVSYLVEGSVKKYDNMFRITVKLINSFDEPVWSQEYDEKIENVLKIQREVSKLIAEQLQVTISPEEEKIFIEAPTDNLKAYENYLKGRFYWGQRTKEDLEQSIYYFNKALELDSTYALAYAGLADAYFIMAWWRWYPKNEGYHKGKEFALKALSVNYNLSEAHATLGGIAMWQDWNWELAEKELKLAISLSPNNATVHQYYSELLNVLGKHKESRVELDLALSLDPHSIILHNVSASRYVRDGNYDKALAENQKIRELNKHFKGNRWIIFGIYMAQNKNRKAIDELKKIVQLNHLNEKYSFNIEEVYQDYGIEGIYKEFILSELKMPDADTPGNLAGYYVFLGEYQNALKYLEILFETRNRSLLGKINNPYYKDLRSEPRFQAIIKKMGLED